MSLFFDAKWFDARLSERGLSRAGLAEAAGLSPEELHDVFSNARAPSGEELGAFAAVLGADLVEVSLHAGVASRTAPEGADTGARIASIEARLDAIDDWLAKLELERKSA